MVPSDRRIGARSALQRTAEFQLMTQSGHSGAGARAQETEVIRDPARAWLDHSFGGGGVGEAGGLIERIQAMIFQRSSEVWMVLPMAGIGPFTVPSPKRL